MPVDNEPTETLGLVCVGGLAGDSFRWPRLVAVDPLQSFELADSSPDRSHLLESAGQLFRDFPALSLFEPAKFTTLSTVNRFDRARNEVRLQNANRSAPRLRRVGLLDILDTLVTQAWPACLATTQDYLNGPRFIRSSRY